MISPEKNKNLAIKTSDKNTSLITSSNSALSVRMEQIKKACLTFTLASASILSTIAPAQALQFNFTYAPNTTVEQIVGFEMAGKIWSNYLTDNVTVNIHVEMVNELPDNVIGGALTGWQANEKYDDFYKALEKDKISADDNTAVDNLKTSKRDKKYSALVNGAEVKDLNKISLTRANAKSLGLLSEDSIYNDLDGYIVFNTLTNKPTSWNYNYTNSNVPQDQLDFLSVATHEIGHILGFASGLDDPGWLTAIDTGYYHDKDIKKDANYFTSLDQFRFSDQSKNYKDDKDKSQPLLDFSVGGGRKFLSLDGGNTILGEMSTGEDTKKGGDGQQASHWKNQNGNPIGIMDPLLNMGVRRNITGVDVRAFDAIGWNVTNVGAGINQQQLDSFYSQSMSYVTSSSLRRDRNAEVNQMIDNSEIYEWGGSGNNACIPTPTKPCPRAWQRAMWQKINTTSTPESSTVGALVAFGLLSIGVYRKGR